MLIEALIIVGSLILVFREDEEMVGLTVLNTEKARVIPPPILHVDSLNTTKRNANCAEREK